MGSTTPNDTAAPHQAAVPIQRCHTNKRCNLFAVQTTQLRQFSQNGTTNNVSDTRHTLEKILLLTPQRTLMDRFVEVLVVALQFRFKPIDVCLDACLYPSRCSAQSVFFGSQHFDNLPSATNQRTQFQSHFIRQQPQRRAHRFCKARQSLSIKSIGLSQLSHSFSKISNLTWVGNSNGELSRHQGTHQSSFYTATSLEHDQNGFDRTKILNQLVGPRSVIEKRLHRSTRRRRHIESSFGYVDADIGWGNFCHR